MKEPIAKTRIVLTDYISGFGEAVALKNYDEVVRTGEAIIAIAQILLTRLEESEK